MSEEKEVVTESNGTEEIENGTNGKEATNEPDVKEPADNEDSVDLDADIIRQVEYYFGDVNFPRDKFLQEQTKLDDGWVPLSILIRFNRLSKLTTDLDVIENALKKSTSGILEVADMKVRRNPEQPVPEMNEDRRKEMISRTIYAKGFPKHASLDEILRFFKTHDFVDNVIMRRYLDPRTKARLFKGSIFATFKTRAQAEKFFEAKDSIKYNGAPLIIMWQEEYTAMKDAERKDKTKKKEKKLKQNAQPEKPEFQLPTGTVVYFEDGHDKMTREEIKTAFSKIDKKADVAFIDFKIGLTKGWIRFSKENAAVDFMELLDNGNIEIGNHKVVLKLLEGDEEKAYLERTLEEMVKRRHIQKAFKKGRTNYKGKNNMKRKNDNDNEDAPPAKVKCDS